MLFGQQPKKVFEKIVPRIGGILGLLIGTSVLGFVGSADLFEQMTRFLYRKQNKPKIVIKDK